jgi:hypothetical protein
MVMMVLSFENDVTLRSVLGLCTVLLAGICLHSRGEVPLFHWGTALLSVERSRPKRSAWRYRDFDSAKNFGKRVRYVELSDPDNAVIFRSLRVGNWLTAELGKRLLAGAGLAARQTKLCNADRVRVASVELLALHVSTPLTCERNTR